MNFCANRSPVFKRPSAGVSNANVNPYLHADPDRHLNADANAFADAGTSNTITLTFTQPGTYGFHCDNHSSMQGAIQVVP